MNKDEFRTLFHKNVDAAIESAAKRINIKPLSTEIELYGANMSGKIMTIEEALDFLYLSEDRFYPTIDISVKSVRNTTFTIFVRISARNPVEFNKTWNTPEGNGPFKILEAIDVKISQQEP
jgi:hypothetical protein